MGHKSKSAAAFRIEIDTFVASLDVGVKLHVRDAFQKYDALLKQQKSGKKPLTEDQEQCLST